MATTVGNTNSKIIISDNATPGSGTYAWYLPANSARMKWPLAFIDGTYVAAEGGITTGTKGFKRNLIWAFRDVPITSDTDFQNLLKIVNYYEANSTLLYLSVKTTDFTTEMAVVGTKAAPTTLGQQTGRLQNFEITRIEGSQVWVNIEFVFQST